MKPYEMVLDRAWIAQASADNEALAWVEDQVRFVETDQVLEKDRVRYVTVDGDWCQVACYARDLDAVAPDIPRVRIAVCPTTVEAEGCWTDPAVHVVVVRGLVFGPLEGMSRQTSHRITIMKNQQGWSMSTPTLYLALRSAG